MLTLSRKGKTMRKVENFLKNWGVGINAVLVIIWALWALQIHRAIIKVLSSPDSPTITLEQMSQALKELEALSEKFVEEAESMGEEYGPEEYFTHLKGILSKGHQLNVNPPFNKTAKFKLLFDKNIREGNVSQEELEFEIAKHDRWYSELKGDVEEGPTGKEALTWATQGYLRTILLIIPFYLIIMNYRRGILETILADKTRFVLAILLWPVMVTKYPYNVVREIRVEAELRRIGKLFRKLSPKEISFVREIANNQNYRSWLNQKRQYNRGLLIALTATIFINLLPSLAKAIQTRVETKLRISANSCEQIDDIGEDNTTNHIQPAMLGEPPMTEPLKQIATIIRIEPPWKQLEPDGIDYVPKFRYLATSMFQQIY